MANSTAAIHFSNVSVRRGDKNALSGVSVSIGGRERVAILGPNGSGKSTFIKTITRELYPTAGSVRLFGEKNWNVRALRSRMGIVSYDVQALFNQEITGREVVLSGFFNSVGLWKNNIVTPDMEKKARRAMKWLGIDRLSNHEMPRLSSGEARRFLIARALVHEPKTMLFDEPMNSLDLEGQGLIKTTLRRLARHGVGIVLVTHHLPDIIPEITRVILLSGGRIIADGRKEKVLTAAKLSECFKTRVSLVHQNGYFHALS